MNDNVYSELRQIRNELAHGRGPRSSDDLAMRLTRLGLAIPEDGEPALADLIIRAHSGHAGMMLVPAWLHPILEKLLAGRKARVVLDPFAGLGEVLATVRAATRAEVALAFTPSIEEATIGAIVVENSEWQTGQPLALLSALDTEIDVVASVLPFGIRHDSPVRLSADTGQGVVLRADLSSLVLAASSTHLAADGVGLFVVSSSFFAPEKSIIDDLEKLGLGIEAALALPFGVFAPKMSVQAYLVIVRKRPFTQAFVGQLSSDLQTNLQILDNLENRSEGATLELGRYVPIQTFRGLQPIRLEERIKEIELQSSTPALRINELSTEITLGQSTPGFEFPDRNNAIFVPLIGNSDVVDSVEDRSLRPQNYAQVVIDPQVSNSGFVAQFLNSELGREIRELSKSGSTILRSNRRTLQDLRVFVPDLTTQKFMLEVEAQLTAEQNTLLGLQNEIVELHRQLWLNPQSASEVEQQVRTMSTRLSGALKQQSEERLEEWCETLPFPLASITRAWQATPSQDFRGKVDHLLHFFEATAEFLSVILLSGFSSNPEIFAEHRDSLMRALRSQHLGFQRATFGTWKIVIENLGKQARVLVTGSREARMLGAELFGDPSLNLPEMLSSKDLVGIVNRTNQARNDWTGHGGVLGQEEARLRHEQLLGELQLLRKAMGNVWTEIELIQALHTRPRRGLFETEIALMMGSNSEFLKENRAMPTFLDVDRLYLTHQDSGRTLLLLPLVTVGPSPNSTLNACYFFNRLESEGARFVSYHFVDLPELREPSSEIIETIAFLSSA